MNNNLKNKDVFSNDNTVYISSDEDLIIFIRAYKINEENPSLFNKIIPLDITSSSATNNTTRATTSNTTSGTTRATTSNTTSNTNVVINDDYTSINLSNNDINDAQFKTLSYVLKDIVFMENLISINLNNNRIGETRNDEIMRLFGNAFYQYDKLETIELKQNKIYNIELFSEIFSPTFKEYDSQTMSYTLIQNKLKKIDLSNNLLQDRDGQIIRDWIENDKFKKLEEFNLSDNFINKIGIDGIALYFNKLPQITNLDISKNPIGINGIKNVINNLTELKKIVSLNISNCDIKDEGAIQLAYNLLNIIEKCEELNNINIINNNISYIGFGVLATVLNTNSNINISYFDTRLKKKREDRILTHIPKYRNDMNINIRSIKYLNYDNTIEYIYDDDNLFLTLYKSLNTPKDLKILFDFNKYKNTGTNIYTLDLSNKKDKLKIKTILNDLYGINMNNKIKLNLQNTYNTILDDIPLSINFEEININDNNFTFDNLNSFFNKVNTIYNYFDKNAPNIIWNKNNFNTTQISNLNNTLNNTNKTRLDSSKDSTIITLPVRPVLPYKYEPEPEPEPEQEQNPESVVEVTTTSLKKPSTPKSAPSIKQDDYNKLVIDKQIPYFVNLEYISTTKPDKVSVQKNIEKYIKANGLSVTVTVEIDDIEGFTIVGYKITIFISNEGKDGEAQFDKIYDLINNNQEIIKNYILNKSQPNYLMYIIIAIIAILMIIGMIFLKYKHII